MKVRWMLTKKGGCMFKVKVIGIVTLAVCLSASVQAATMKIRNESSGTINVDPQWDGRCGCYDRLGAGEEKLYDSGIATIKKVRWTERPVAPTDPKFAQLVPTKIYETEITLWNLNLGALFKIYNGGSYRYEFGITNGSGDGNAKEVSDL
jgi:hypothetical protein